MLEQQQQGASILLLPEASLARLKLAREQKCLSIALYILLSLVRRRVLGSNQQALQQIAGTRNALPKKSGRED